MSDVKCPYCKNYQEINHDEDYKLEEDVEYEKKCFKCNKVFMFTPFISYSYEVFCKKEDHKMEPLGDEFPGIFYCSECKFFENRK